MENKIKKIFITAGKGRNGKDTVCLFIKEICEEKGLKVINLAYGSYIKEYTKKITGWDGSEETKEQVRSILQQIGTEVIRDQIDENFFIKRIIDDIRVYSYFFDVITISDARLESEIEIPKKELNNIVSVHVERTNFETNLTSNEQKHRTETGLDNYNLYDYNILNSSTLEHLKNEVRKMVEGEL
ncbi:MAG: hypothetical protein RR404_04185 [Bacilli bacterium]